MQAVGKKNLTSLHSLYDFVLMTRGIHCFGTGGPNYKRTRGLLCFGISPNPLATFIGEMMTQERDGMEEGWEGVSVAE